MKSFRQTTCLACHVIAAALAIALFTSPLFAQQPQPMQAGPVTKLGFGDGDKSSPGNDMITLPLGWNVLYKSPVAGGAPAIPVASTPANPVETNPASYVLLLTAVKGTSVITLYSYRTGESGAAPGPRAGDVREESAKLIQTVLIQGYVPATVRTAGDSTMVGKPVTTIEVVAKGIQGETRVFDLAANQWDAPGDSPHYRMFCSHGVTDAQAAQDIALTIKTLNFPLAAQPAAPAVLNPGVAAQNPPGTPPASASGTNASVAATQTQPQPPPAAPPGPGANNSVSVLAPAGPASAQTAQIVQDYHGALVMVEGNQGVGSGFVCKLDDGKTYVMTNAHVLADNSGVKITNLDGTALTTGSSAVAVGHDIVKLETAAAPKAFEIMTDIQNNAKIGDAVMIPGNAEGAQVVRPVEGKIVGIGPNLIEVDAPFVKGNSGSPIIHVATGRVLGVATYLMQRKVSQDASGKVVYETRRFGYRIDSVKQWQPVNWQIFYAESAQVAAIEDLSEDFITMFDDGDNLSPDKYKSPTLARIVRSFLEKASILKANGSKADREDALRSFFADLRAAAHSDIATFNSRPAYDYFQRDVEDQARFRDELYDNLTRAMQNTSR